MEQRTRKICQTSPFLDGVASGITFFFFFRFLSKIIFRETSWLSSSSFSWIWKKRAVQLSLLEAKQDLKRYIGIFCRWAHGFFMFPTYPIHSQEQEEGPWWNPGPSEIKANFYKVEIPTVMSNCLDTWKGLQTLGVCEVRLHASVNGRHKE